MSTPLASTEAYETALRNLDELGMAASSKTLLSAHYAMPHYVATMQHLAGAIGRVGDHKWGNLLYGSLAGRIRRELGLKPLGISLWALATWPEEPIDERGDFAFRMRPEVAQALERLGWVEERVIASGEGPASAMEGKRELQLRIHRHRERWLRDAKVASTAGKLCCQVPNCGFDFEKIYGEAGKGYIQVHHLKPLNTREAPEATRLEDLMLICANCHVIIHRDRMALLPESLIAKRSPVHSDADKSE